MFLLKSFIPELDYWFGKTLYNNNLTSKYINHPIKVSDNWISKDSVLNILFNETCDPSGNTYDGYHYIYKYRTCNLDKLYPFDSTFYRRTQIYRNRMEVWACDDPTNQKLQEIENLALEPWIIDPSSSTDEIADRAGVTPTKYVTKFKSIIHTTASDELHQTWIEPDPPQPVPSPSVYTPDTNVFKLTQEELNMIEFLYYYRTGQFEIIPDWEDSFFNQLVSPLSKWVFVYIMCYLYGEINYQHLNTITNKSHGAMRCMFEKYVQDRVYQYVQKEFNVIYNEIHELSNPGELRRQFIDYTMPCQTFISRRRLTDPNISMKKIVINVDQDSQPNDSNNFEFIYDGVIQTQGIDYKVVNEGTLKDTQACVILLSDKFKSGSRYQMLWNCLTPSTPFNRPEF